MFTWTDDLIEENELGLEVIKKSILRHLTTLVTQYDKRFSRVWNTEKQDWLRKPFNITS
jgi:hypothetical protein